MRFFVGALVVMSLGGLVACATPGADPVQLRVLVKLHDASPDAAVLARQASAIAGVPVQYAAAVGAQWHALVLRCATGAECEAAVERLRADHAAFESVERDARKRIGPR